MLRSGLCCFLILVLLIPAGPAIAEQMSVQEVKTQARKIEAARATGKVKMRDGTILQGKLIESSEEAVTVVTKHGPQTVSYADVAQVKKKGLHPVAKVAIGVGIAIGFLFGVVLAVCGTAGCH